MKNCFAFRIYYSPIRLFAYSIAHMHQVVDWDAYFVISSTNREITTTSTKLELMQDDHQSEYITFESPRFIDGHDMSLSYCVKIHYINTENYNYTA